ncbi:MAG: hypothetical protein K9I94_01885 [Bacteroidales bacterium]|nr:hypothetical protein [Bacteroidales bacterium]
MMNKSKFQKYFFSLLSFLFLISIAIVAQESTTESSPILEKDGQPVDGKVAFKFAIVSNSTTLWSNDGSSVNGNEPEKSLKISIEKGKYDIELGIPPMKPLYYDLVAKYPNPVLKTWIDMGEGFIACPDRKVSLSEISELDETKYPAVRNGEEKNNSDMAYHAPPLIRDPEMIKAKIEKKKHKEKNKSYPKSPADRFKYRYLQRAGEDGKIPRGALLKAKKHIDEMWDNRQRDAGLWDWEWLGPGNIGGRIRAIMIHPDNPDKMWIGGASGGIWKTANGGSYWQPVNDFLPSLNITSFAMDPNDYDVMYASTGEGFGNSWPDVPGAGIFKSTNGGLSWYQLPETNVDSFNWVTRLAHHPENSDIVYATGRVGSPGNWDGKVYKTTDGGDTWNTILNTPSFATDVKLKPADPSIVFVGTTNGLWISNNSGQDWDEVTTGGVDKLPANSGRCEIGVCESYASRVYASLERNGGEIWRSNDSGDEWDLRNSGTNYMVGSSNQGWYDNAIWVSPVNSSLVVVGGIDLYRSTDGGSNLTKISDWRDYHNGGASNSAHADHHIILEHPDYDGDFNNTVYFGNDGGIQMASNVGTVSQNSGWTNLANNLGITQFYAGGASPDGGIIVGGAQDNSYMIYTSGGGTGNWVQPNTGDGGYSSVNYNNTDIMFSSTQRLDVKKSTDGGANWSASNNGLLDTDNCAAFIAPVSMDPNDPTTLVGGGCSIWRTTNSATNWSSIRGSLGGNIVCTAVDIADGNSSKIWIGYSNGHLAYSDDAGSSWTRVDNNGDDPLPNRWITDIAINANNHDELFVTFAGYNDDNVWLTNDGGDSWLQSTGEPPHDLPELQVNTVRYHPANSNWIYIGTDLGIFASENKGYTWSTTPRYEDNEGPVNVEVDELFWAGDELIAATYGRGMFKSRPLDYIYVDKDAPPGGDGSWGNPYDNVTDAANAAGHGSNIYIYDGTYSESPLIFYKRGLINVVNGAVVIE